MVNSRGVLLCYIDDNPEGIFENYLFDFSSNHENVKFEEHKFLPSIETYESLLSDPQVSKSDIIVIDLKLFGKLQVQVSHPDKPVSACCN